MTKYSYSLDDETYHGEFDTVEDALAEATQAAADDATTEEAHDRIVWIGEIASGEDFLRARNQLWLGDLILEEAECYLGDKIGAEKTIIELTESQRIELGELVTKWLCENASFNAFGIKNAKKHTVKVEAV